MNQFLVIYCMKNPKNITSEGNKYIHLTCKMQPLYLLKSI